MPKTDTAFEGVDVRENVAVVGTGRWACRLFRTGRESLKRRGI